MPDRNQAFRAFETWLQRLETEPAVMLRPKPIDPASSFEGDYDFIADPRALSRIVAAAIGAATEQQAAIEVDQSRQFKTRFLFLTNDPEVTLLAEVWPHAELLVRGTLSAVPWEQVDRRRDRAGEVSIPLLALLYVGHLELKGKDLQSDMVCWRLERFATMLRVRDDEESLRSLAIVEDLAAGRISLSTAGTAAVDALRLLGVRFDRITSMSPQRIATAIRRRTHRDCGLRMVPFIGPDGVGKSALIASVEASGHLEDLFPEQFTFKKSFRDALPIRLLLRASRWRERRTSDKTARNLLEERHSHLILISALVRWPLLWAGRARRGRRSGYERIVLIDRYFWDYLLQLRAPSEPPRRVTGARLYGKLVPRPDRVVLLTSPIEVIRARKDELSAEAIAALYLAYTEHLTAARVSHVLLLSTEIPLDTDHAELIQFLRRNA